MQVMDIFKYTSKYHDDLPIVMNHRHNGDVVVSNIHIVPKIQESRDKSKK